MNFAPAISVIMPVLNEEQSLESAVESVLTQDGCGEIELLIVDGRSADKTLEVSRRLAAEDPRVRVLDNPQVSIPAGLNVGLADARGEFVARVDGHAELSREYFARAVTWLRAEDRVGGVGGKKVGVARSRVGRAIALVLSSPFGVGNSINHYGSTAQITDHASFGVYRSAAAREVGGWDEGLPVNEDVDFDHRLAQAGYKLGYDPAMIFSWHMREDLAGLARQYRRYGRGKAAMVRKNGRRAVRARHLVPPAVVGASVVLLGLGVRRPSALLGFVPYGLVVVHASRKAWKDADRSNTAGAAIPPAFVITHFAWGIGFLEGLVLGQQPALASGSAKTSDRPVSSPSA